MRFNFNIFAERFRTKIKRTKNQGSDSEILQLYLLGIIGFLLFLPIFSLSTGNVNNWIWDRGRNPPHIQNPQNQGSMQFHPYSVFTLNTWIFPVKTSHQIHIFKPQISEICNTSFSYRSFLLGCESENSHRWQEKNPFKNFMLLRIWIDFGTEELRFYTTCPS